MSRPVRTFHEMLTAMRMARARQRHLFCKNRLQLFRWEQTLFPADTPPLRKELMTTTTTTQLYRQGDVLLQRVDSIPRDGAVKRENGVIAYGEATGHKHAIADLDAAEVFDCGEGLYVHVGQTGVSIIHDEHATIELPPGDYQVTLQREYSPEEVRTVVD